MKSKKSFVALLSVLSVFFSVCAFAAYPTKQITVLQGFKAGGGSDTLAQLTQPYLEKILGKSFVNQYIPGATGAIAWTQLAKTSKKDGYTISITNTPMVTTNYIMNSEIVYSISELEPIANVVTDPGVIVVPKDSPFKTVQDFLKFVKENPGKVTVSNSGVGGDDFFASLIFQKKTGYKIQMIPFQGDGPSWQAAMGGKVDVSFNNLGITYPQIKAGNLRAIAIFDSKRYEGLPDVPTMTEAGIKLISGSSRGYSAPKGISQEVKNTLINAFKKMAADPKFVQGCKDRASIIDMQYGDEYAKMLKDQEAEFTEIWNEVKGEYQKKQ